MGLRFKYFIVLAVCVLLGSRSSVLADSGKQPDSLVASLLTCSPGTQIYEYYGHTALRIRNVTTGEDWAFNYGLFDYNAPHFVWRFVRGDTEYQLGVIRVSDFLPEYRSRGSYVEEQVLNLTKRELARLFLSLIDNCAPQNRFYHYDMFYDNCATRVRDKIEECVEGRVLFQPVPDKSIRDIIQEYAGAYRWSTFGQNLVLGAETDRPASRSIQEFAPLYLARDIRNARIQAPDGSIRPLVKSDRHIVEARTVPVEESFPVPPAVCALLVLAAGVVVSILDIRHRKTTWFFDAILLGFQGIAGCLIAFLFFFSLHPTVDTNWLIAIFNPLTLVYLPWEIRKSRAMQPDLYHKVAAVVLALFLLASPLIPQHFDAAIILLALLLLMRSVCRVYVQSISRSPR